MNDPVRTMRAMRAASPNPASLTFEQVPVPEPGPGEPLVEVCATAVTAGELTWPESWPTIPCQDLSGTVAATGHRVTRWRPGDDIYGLVGFDRPGAAAEYVTAPAVGLAVKRQLANGWIWDLSSVRPQWPWVRGRQGPAPSPCSAPQCGGRRPVLLGGRTVRLEPISSYPWLGRRR